MEFHISRNVREKYGVNEVLFNYAGNVVFGNIAASRELASRINTARGAAAAPEKTIHAGALFAMGLIDELSHALIAYFRKTRDARLLTDALRWFAAQTDPAQVELLLTRFTAEFPNTAIFRGEKTIDEWFKESTEGMSHREAALEELILLWLANVNPAFKPFRELFDDEGLQTHTIYKQATDNLDAYFATRPRLDPRVGTLLDALRAPMLASPDSLTGQLAYIKENWAPFLGDELRRVLLAMDILKEEEIAIWMLFHPPDASKWHPERHFGGREGFIGDEYVGLGEGRRGARGSGMEEYEAFSPDQAWMPTVVLIAKSTYVWLEQLSKKYQRHIYRLDQIPDEELDLLVDRGINALWLIGLWERSTASQTIKRLRGQWDAVASAYSLADYRIADDLGGEFAYRNLRDRAAARGIRLASDMVPNHMGIDSKWVMEHPEWFLSRHDSPYPSYSFEGPDLSNDSRIELKIEDHYFDQTDAAVVFRRRVRATGETEYIYHGNDGTTFAWNDTAQLNYSKAEVREQVIQTILEVARLFPIIRFDAAMTLAKKHVQRLWFPLPGSGGSIPSRAESSMTQEEFDAIMPNEFWREVVDRVAQEVPGTLLLAEAFWLLEGYFVRTLGMHRVYNSAFMNMLRDQENAKYRSYLRKTIEFDPDILKRYVNFMSNPDERTAIDQFGTEDRYFGVCTMLATLPGLPMFGHGQIEGFVEKYGMEYKQARMDEYPNEGLIARHQREIAPLLKNRKLFAESTHFVLYDFWTPDGYVDENVFAYSNRLHEERAIILFNNRYGDTRGTIHRSVESMDKMAGHLRSRWLREALDLPSEEGIILAFQDAISGLQYLRRSQALDHEGLTVDLRAYQYMVLQNWRVLRPTSTRPWDRLCDSLYGAGVYSLDEAMDMLRLQPVHKALRELLSDETIQKVIHAAIREDLLVEADCPSSSAPELHEAVPNRSASVASDPDNEAPLLAAIRNFFENAHTFKPEWRSAEEPLSYIKPSLKSVIDMPATLDEADAIWPEASRAVLPFLHPETMSPSLWAQVLAWCVLRQLSADPKRLPLIFDRFHLRSVLAEASSSLGIDGEDAWRVPARIRLLLAHRPDGSTPLEAVFSSKSFWEDTDVKWLLGVNEYRQKLYFNRESFEQLVFWLLLPEIVGTETKDKAVILSKAEAVLLAARKSGYEVAALVAVLQSPQRAATAETENKAAEKTPAEPTHV